MGRIGWILLITGIVILCGIDFWLGYGFGRLSIMDDLKHCLSQKAACECPR